MGNHAGTCYDPRFMFALNLRLIRAPREHVERVYQPDAFAGDADGFAVVSPVVLSCDVEKHNDEFRLAGGVRTTLGLACSRCLESFKWPVDAAFDLRYRPHTATADAEEREIEEEDFSNAFYDGEEIDLGQLIRERLYLSLPMKPLCQEACRGLCWLCGTNLNRGTCACRREWKAPRLAALKTLKKDS